MSEKAGQLFLQEDMAQFASDISHSNFNIKQFKKTHASKAIKLANHKTRTRINTDHLANTALDSSLMHSRTLAEGLNKTLRYNDTHKFTRKQAKLFSKPMFKSVDKLEQFKSKQKSSSLQKSASNLQKYETEWSKGRMKERSIEQWLNAVLVQYCHDEYFDKNITNSALKKLGVDQNSLIAKGLPPQNVSRIYRGLFVFGMGFNSLIGELTNGNMEVLKTIWRIYSIILQYCSKGGMVTVIGEIQRDTSSKVAALTNEIVRRQEIIEKNEELNEQKNEEIFKEIKKLRDQNNNLNNQKIVLVEEYNTTEQAFGEQVNLRLKFQTKINEIYGLHRQLGIKHQKIYQDFINKVQELRICADKYFEATIKTQQFRQTQYKLRQELILLKMSFKKEKQFSEELVKQRILLMNKVSKLQFNLLQQQSELTELKNKSKMWLNEKVNMEAMIKFREKSSKETHTEYQMTLQENNRLYILLSDQRKVMEEYEKQKKNFNSRVISIVSENSYHKRKMQQIQRKYDGLQQQYKLLGQKFQKQNLQLQIKQKNQESYQSFFTNSQQSLVQMRRIHIAHQQQLEFLRKYYKNMEQVLKGKNDLYQSLHTKYTETFDELQNVSTELKELKSKYELIIEQKRINEQVFSIKQAKIKVIHEQLLAKQQNMQKIKVRYAIEQDNLRTQIDKAMINYKNQKFERSTLNSSYHQALKMIQKKNITERQLNVKISLLEAEIQKQKNKYHVLQNKLMNTVEDFNKTQRQYEQTLNLQRDLIVQKMNYVHPMLLEDSTAGLQREIIKNHSNQILIKRLDVEIQKQKKIKMEEVQKLHQKYRWDINVLNKQAQTKIERLASELSFEKHQNSSLKGKVKSLQQMESTYKLKIKQHQSSNKEQIYKREAEQKKKQLERMMSQMQKLQDRLQQTQKNAIHQSAREQQVKQHNHHHIEKSSPHQIWDEKERLKFLDAAKKELQHQFNLKLREIQRQMKQQYLRKQQQRKYEHEAMIKGMSVQEFLRIKQLKAAQLIKELSITQRADKFRERTSNHSLEMNRNSFYQSDTKQGRQEQKNRRRMGNLIKNAYEYYN